MSKKAIIGTLLSFILVTGGIVYTISNSLQHNKKRADIINNEKVIIDTAKAPNELKDGEYQASAEGYEGPITVKVIIKDGKIFSVDVISQNETPEYYELAKKILQSIVEKNTFNVDSISGATVTADAIKIAVYKALLQAGAKSSDVAINLEKGNKELREKEKSKISEKLSNIVAGTVSLTNEKLKDGTFIGTGFGYNGPIRVSVTVRNGVIVAVNVISHNEDYPYFGWALRVLSNILSGNKNVDTVSGATVSSRGILNAINNALLQAGAEKKQFEVEQISKTDENIKQNKSSETDIEQIKKGFKNLVDGVYIGSSSGYYDNSIQVKVTVQNGKISKIELMKNNDDSQYFDSDKAKILEQRIVNKQSTDIDTVTNATVSSKGYINAVVKALEKAVNQNGTQADKYIRTPNTIISSIGEEIEINRIKNSLENLPENAEIKIKKNANINIIGKSEIIIEVLFSDGSRKIINIPVVINEKTEGLFKFLTAEEVKNLDSNNKYPDGEYYGDSYGFVPNKPIPVKVIIKNGNITNIDIVKEELNRLTGRTTPGRIDDGSIFEPKFFTIADIIKNKQNPNAIAYKFGVLREVTNRVIKFAKEKEPSVQTYRDALDRVVGKHKFGKNLSTINEQDINNGKRAIEEKIFYLMKVYVKEELNYDNSDYDAVSGATFTATGTANAIKNALDRTSSNIDFYDFRIVEKSYKTSYKEGEKLNLKDLQIELFKKSDKSKVIIPYNEFEKNGFKIVLANDTDKEIKDSLTLTKQALNFDIVNRGLNLKLIHKKSNSFKFLNTILVEANRIKCDVKSIEIREKGTNDWIKTQGFKKDEFIQYLSVEMNAAKKLIGKEVEFRLTTTIKETGKEKIFTLSKSFGQKDMIAIFNGVKDYTVNINSSEIYGFPPYSVPFTTYRIHLNEIIGLPKADKYVETPSKLVISKNKDLDSNDVKKVLHNLPQNTSISIVKNIDKNIIEKEQTMIVKLKFDDNSEKEITVTVVIKDKIIGMADEYNEVTKNIITIKGQKLTNGIVKRAFPNLPNSVNIQFDESFDVNEITDGKPIEITLIFKDNTKKVVKTNVVVKKEINNNAEEFSVLNSDITEKFVKVIVDDQKYHNEDKFSDTLRLGSLTDTNIERDLDLKNKTTKISYIEIIQHPDRTKLGNTKAKIRLIFKDASKLELEIAVKIVPYPVTKIYSLKSNKNSYNIEKDTLKLSELTATLFMANSVKSDGTGWNGNGTPVINIPYSDFKLFGLKVINLDNNTEIKDNTKISKLIKDGKLNIGIICEGLVVVPQNEDEKLKAISEIKLEGEINSTNNIDKKDEIYSDDSENGNNEYKKEVENKDKNKNAIQNESVKNEQGSVNKKQDLDKNKQKNSEKPIEKPSDKNSISDKVLTDKAPKFNKESKETIK
ncbi:MAG: FMN-binding protein [Peptoniphilaceae bacterium]|uniref:FMN-binding protein n=3 Tax=Parvimonas sp. TaxID=1944660 RepID=UPI002A75D00B|nr:FMN-binding protein [Parvimonas sp.]MDD7765507.1 FMN-binding protein [Peptoniphilaceae bacterium]MDY3051048.1 FMN-binding protein [Parvimonas sp.]